jgi:UDPglucose 6-dehydrogenase
MMKVTVIGLGYVGLTNAVYLATQHKVMGYDIDYSKINDLQQGHEYLQEEYVEGFLRKNQKNLQFSDRYESFLSESDVALVAVPTPEGEHGHADLTALYDALDKIIAHSKKNQMVVIRSTVPPGTLHQLIDYAEKHQRHDLAFVSVPEFLALGTAMNDVLEPNRVIVGLTNTTLKPTIKKLFNYPSTIPYVFTTPQTAELIKYASNSFLATKISFINEMSQLAEVTNANIEEVVEGMALDSRIGSAFLKPGVGFGGSCFPKDLKALRQLALNHQLNNQILQATLTTNQQQTERFTQRILNRFSNQIKGKKIAVLGLSYKGTTHDVRNSPAFTVVDMLTNQEAIIFAYDKKATIDFFNLRGEKPCLAFAVELVDALKDAECAIILNDAPELKTLKAKDFIKLMKTPIVFDGRNLYALDKMSGVEYHSIGRPTIKE